MLLGDIGISRLISGTWKNFVLSLITCFIAYLINEIWLKNHFDFPVFVPTLLGTALAFFIGFNNNQSYDRWWEARKIWGSIVNDSRTWARNVLKYTIPNEKINAAELQELKQKMVTRHIAFLYLLKDNLRNTSTENAKAYLGDAELEEISNHTNKYNALLSLQSADVATLREKDAIDGFTFLELNKMITAFCDEMGKSERIKNTVFPTIYHYYSKSFIWIFIYSVTMTIGTHIGIWSVIFGTLVGYVFFTIQAIGKLLLNPFEMIPTGIPLDQITRTIEINLLEMLEKESIPEPVQSVKDEYIM